MKTSNKQMHMFATQNDTDNYVLIVDGLFGFISEKQAKEFRMDVENSTFGSWNVLKPRESPKSIFDGADMTETKISEGLPIDIFRYIQKNSERSKLNHKQEYLTPKQKIENKRSLYAWFLS